MPVEKADRYTLYVLDKSEKILHILDARETSPEEEEKQMHKDFQQFDGQSVKNINNQVAKLAESRRDAYHSHRNKIVSIYECKNSVCQPVL